HGFHFHQRSRLPSKLYSLATERALAGLTDMLLTQNREDLRLVRRWRGVRARLIGNGIDVQRFARVARPPAGPGRVVACIARFEAVKNHHDLLRVFARVRAACPQARLRLLEDPALRRRLGAAAAERVRTHFNESVVVAHLARVYASLLREAGYPLPTSWETHDERAVLSA